MSLLINAITIDIIIYYYILLTLALHRHTIDAIFIDHCLSGYYADDIAIIDFRHIAAFIITHGLLAFIYWLPLFTLLFRWHYGYADVIDGHYIIIIFAMTLLAIIFFHYTYCLCHTHDY